MSKGFESKLLYDQHSPSEEGTSVLSSVYAILWTYPGAVTKTSARIRTTIVYHKDGEMIVVLGGTIEKWRNEGWSLLEEYHDASHEFYELAEGRERLLSMAESFLMGTPLADLDSSYTITSGPWAPRVPDTPTPKPSFKVLDYNTKKAKKVEDKDNDNKEKSKKDKDFDWV